MKFLMKKSMLKFFLHMDTMSNFKKTYYEQR